MCGLVGAVGDLTPDMRKALWMLLRLDTIRGPHSTGVFTLKKGAEKGYVDRLVGTPWEWAEVAKARHTKGVPDVNTEVYIGHNRYATRGKINNANAHPFICGHIVGAHNGTLTHTHKLDHNIECDTDSQALYMGIQHNGLKDTYERLAGAWALTWYDFNESKTHFMRNDQRPLYYARVTDTNPKGVAYFWASEEWMLEVVADRYDLGITGKIKEVQPHRVYTITTDDGAKGEQKVSLRKGEKLTPYSPPVPKPYEYKGYNGHQNFTMGGAASGGNVVALPKPSELSTLQSTFHQKYIPIYFNGATGQMWEGKEMVTNAGTDVRLISHSKDKSRILEAEIASHWFIGKVSFVSSAYHLGKSTGLLTIDFNSLSEPIPWVDFPSKGLEPDNWEHFLQAKGIVDLSVYTQTFIKEYIKTEPEVVIEPEDSFRIMGKFVNKDELVGYLCNGCGTCSNVMDIEDFQADKVHPLFGTDSYVCDECFNNHGLMEAAGLQYGGLH